MLKNISVRETHAILIKYLGRITFCKKMMMALKFSRNAKVASALTDRRSMHPAADDDLEILFRLWFLRN